MSIRRAASCSRPRLRARCHGERTGRGRIRVREPWADSSPPPMPRRVLAISHGLVFIGLRCDAGSAPPEDTGGSAIEPRTTGGAERRDERDDPVADVRLPASTASLCCIRERRLSSGIRHFSELVPATPSRREPAAHLPPMPWGRVAGGRSPATGQQIEGFLFAGATPSDLTRDPEFTYRRLDRTARLADRPSADPRPGAFTKVAGDASAVARRAPIAVTAATASPLPPPSRPPRSPRSGSASPISGRAGRWWSAPPARSARSVPASSPPR